MTFVFEIFKSPFENYYLILLILVPRSFADVPIGVKDCILSTIFERWCQRIVLYKGGRMWKISLFGLNIGFVFTFWLTTSSSLIFALIVYFWYRLCQSFLITATFFSTRSRTGALPKRLFASMSSILFCCSRG